MVRMCTILLCFLYTFSATGATAYLHYCCGETAQLVFTDESETSDDCPLCVAHSKQEKDCCTEDIPTDTANSCHVGDDMPGHCQDVKVEAKRTTADHLPGGEKNIAKIYPLELLAFTLAGLVEVPARSLDTSQTVADAPPRATIPLFIQHCIYRI